MANELEPNQEPYDYSNWRKKVPFESFEGTAMHLGIPRESWEDPEVVRFVDLINRVSQLQHDLSIADANNIILNIPKERYTELNSGFEFTLSEKYSSAELLMRVGFEILLDGFPNRVAHPNYIKGKLNPAIGGYGLKVVESQD